MALMMIYSSKKEKQYIHLAEKSGFDCYQTDNIYQFLRYAKEAKPDVVMIRFSKKFNVSRELMEDVKKSVCGEDICPPIYLNMPEDFEGEKFFQSVNFEKEDIKKYLH